MTEKNTDHAGKKQSNISEAELARRLGQITQNFYHKMKLDNFSEEEQREIAVALPNCALPASLFTTNRLTMKPGVYCTKGR